MIVASMALAVMGARAMLLAVLHVMAHPPAPVRIRWGGAAIFAALFWLWYMAPGIAAQVPQLLTSLARP